MTLQAEACFPVVLNNCLTSTAKELSTLRCFKTATSNPCFSLSKSLPRRSQKKKKREQTNVNWTHLFDSKLLSDPLPEETAIPYVCVCVCVILSLQEEKQSLHHVRKGRKEGKYQTRAKRRPQESGANMWGRHSPPQSSRGALQRSSSPATTTIAHACSPKKVFVVLCQRILLLRLLRASNIQQDTKKKQIFLRQNTRSSHSHSQRRPQSLAKLLKLLLVAASLDLNLC